jgi:hypothetical protein
VNTEHVAKYIDPIDVPARGDMHVHFEPDEVMAIHRVRLLSDDPALDIQYAMVNHRTIVSAYSRRPLVLTPGQHLTLVVHNDSDEAKRTGLKVEATVEQKP